MSCGCCDPATAPEIVRTTEGRCPECFEEVPATVLVEHGEVRLVKECPTHGRSHQHLARSPGYWDELDRFYFRVNREEYPQRDFIVRMTESCNLDCPICLAKANTEDTPDLDLTGLEELLSQRRGIKIDLMAAEPTLREDLEDWVRRVKATGNIAALHTNGLKLARREYAQRIKEAGVDEVFVQFDGFDDDAHEVLRGRRLVKARLEAMDNLRALGIATSLIVVIAKGLNEAQVSETLRFALEPGNEHIKEVFFMGLRLLGSARDAVRRADSPLDEMALMPDDLVELLCDQEPSIRRDDIRAFNKLYFALLSTFRVRKCLYIQHYLVARGADGGMVPFADLVDLPALERAAETYADRFRRNPRLARAGLLASFARHGVNGRTLGMLGDLLRMQLLLKQGMDLSRVPQRFLLIGFITACDPYNFDAQVAVNCGKGELSVDRGFTESSAVANVEREAAFERSGLLPGTRKTKEREERKAGKTRRRVS